LGGQLPPQGKTTEMHSDSDLSLSGKARVINYAWGKAKVEDVQRLIDRKNMSNQSVAVHVSELYQGWLSGLVLWGQDLDKDSNRSDRVRAKAEKFFAELRV
jgi:hypothetical protein